MWTKSGTKKPYPKHLPWRFYSALLTLSLLENNRLGRPFTQWRVVGKLEKLGLVAQASTRTGLLIMVTKLGLECLADNH
jgi:hypothetical protein